MHKASGHSRDESAARRTGLLRVPVRSAGGTCPGQVSPALGSRARSPRPAILAYMTAADGIEQQVRDSGYTVIPGLISQEAVTAAKAELGGLVPPRAARVGRSSRRLRVLRSTRTPLITTGPHQPGNVPPVQPDLNEESSAPGRSGARQGGNYGHACAGFGVAAQRAQRAPRCWERGGNRNGARPATPEACSEPPRSPG